MSDVVLVFESGQKYILALRPEKTVTVEMLLGALPFTSKANRWGDEVYFDCPFHAELEADATQDMDLGEVAYWPDGDAIAVFFGRTPVSTGREPRAYSPCNIVGRIEGDLSGLRDVRSGDSVQLRAE